VNAGTTLQSLKAQPSEKDLTECFDVETGLVGALVADDLDIDSGGACTRGWESACGYEEYGWREFELSTPCETSAGVVRCREGCGCDRG
jgi:hypothetical protein